MNEPIEMTVPDGEYGYHVVVEPHRCSRKSCDRPAIIFYSFPSGGFSGRSRRHERRRWTCDVHLNEYGTRWWVEDGRLWRDRHDFERES